MPRVLKVDQALDNLNKENPLDNIVNAWRTYCASSLRKWTRKKVLSRWNDPALRAKVRAMDVALGRDYQIATQLLVYAETLGLGINKSIQQFMKEKQEIEESFETYRKYMRQLYRSENPGEVGIGASR